MKTRPPPSRRLVWLALPALLTLASACHSLPDAPAPAASTAELWQQLQTESQRNGCQHDQQCHSLGVGSKACGGPERYLAWSDYQRHDQRLQQLATAYAAARSADDQRQQLMSNCALVPDPGAQCRAGRCELRPPATGPANSIPAAR